MFRLFAAANLFIVLTVQPPSALAGLYCTSEKNQVVRSTDYRAFKTMREELRRYTINRIQMEKGYVIRDSLPRQRALMIAGLFDPLSLRRSAEKPAAEDCLNASAYLIRLGKTEKARMLLEHAVAEYPDDFLLSANLGTYYHFNGIQSRSAANLQTALRNWPENYDDLTPEQKARLRRIQWTPEKHAWLRRVEEYHFKLVLNGFNTQIPEFAGALFQSKDGKPLRFVNEAGVYEPGKLVKAERDKIPADGLKIVQQLYVWFANNPALERKTGWLIAELYAARGSKSAIKDAYDILRNQVFTGAESSPVIRDHRRKLKLYLDSLDSQKNKKNGGKTSVIPTAPKKTGETKVEKKKGTEAAWDTSWWRMLAIGFGVGVVVGSLGFWQMWMLFGRRR